MELPRQVLNILNKLNENGREAYVVGGCVRDFLLGKKPKDYDIATSALPLEVKRLFSKTVDTGIKHGTVTVLTQGVAIEVTTYRIDGKYTDNRRPETVEFTASLKEDLLRRDFTVNAIAYHPELGFVDYFEGMSDLKQKIIRGVGNPAKRFDEDALRMLRALRFAAVLRFEIENETKKAIFQKAELIKNISAERIRDELLKIITSGFPEILNLLAGSALLFYPMPKLHNYLENNLEEIRKALSKCQGELAHCLAAFFIKSDAKTAQTFMLELRMDKKTVNEVATLLKWVNEPAAEDMYQTRKMLSKIGHDALRSVYILKEKLSGVSLAENFKMLNTVLENNECCLLKDLAVSGNDIMEVSHLKGKQLGEALEKLLDCVHKNPAENTKEILLRKVCNEGGFMLD
ncbi:MAG: CCA tRNA nucleotidyltransferase [Clostridiales bacterium]|nr:CCA tRNA nucleotidyltransferase [Clostridiales bacterium]